MPNKYNAHEDLDRSYDQIFLSSSSLSDQEAIGSELTNETFQKMALYSPISEFFEISLTQVQIDPTIFWIDLDSELPIFEELNLYDVQVLQIQWTKN